MMESYFVRAYHFSSFHRKDLEKDDKCGCFYCLKIFSPSEITAWCDNGETALCPYCEIDSVIGESSGFSITELLLRGMHKEWF